MMKHWIIALCFLPLMIHAQDFTRENGTEERGLDDGSRAELLVVPYHPHYHISEVDRMMCPADMDANTFREKLRSLVNRELCMAFSDSLEAIDLAIQAYDESIDIQEYMYNAMDYEYVQMKEEEERKKRFDIGLAKRKEERVYGAKNHTRKGQIDREEILYDRYMMAQVANEGALEYLQDRYGFDHLLVITQLEIRRDLDAPSAGNYLCSLHLSLIDSQGVLTDGYKETLSLAGAQLEFGSFKQEVLPGLADEVLKRFWPKINSQAQTSTDNTDY